MTNISQSLQNLQHSIYIVYMPNGMWMDYSSITYTFPMLPSLEAATLSFLYPLSLFLFSTRSSVCWLYQPFSNLLLTKPNTSREVVLKASATLSHISLTLRSVVAEASRSSTVILYSSSTASLVSFSTLCR